MDNLLDTHTFIWYVEGNSSLSPEAKTLIEAGNAVNYISIASLWEMSIKISTGKLVLNTAFSSLAYYITYNGFQILPIAFQDTLIICGLPYHHRDPFDRILIAQAINNNLQIITKDETFKSYSVSLIW